MCEKAFLVTSLNNWWTDCLLVPCCDLLLLTQWQEWCSTVCSSFLMHLLISPLIHLFVDHVKRQPNRRNRDYDFVSAYWRQSQSANCTSPISQRKAAVFAVAGVKDVKLYHIFLPQASLPTLRFGACMQTWKYLYLKLSKESCIS